ncbi:hypothetical protein D9M68_437370 [compost metagenome]
MSFLNELINSVSDEELRTQLHERIDIVVHKLKFTEPVPVACLTINHTPHPALDHVVSLAGGEPVNDPLAAKVILYFEHRTGIPALMSAVIAGLQPDWPAVVYSRIYLLDDAKMLVKEPQDWVACLEDVAEMLHPGYFVFGNEGTGWVNYSI